MFMNLLLRVNTTCPLCTYELRFEANDKKENYTTSSCMFYLCMFVIDVFVFCLFFFRLSFSIILYKFIYMFADGWVIIS